MTNALLKHCDVLPNEKQREDMLIRMGTEIFNKSPHRREMTLEKVDIKQIEKVKCKS